MRYKVILVPEDTDIFKSAILTMFDREIARLNQTGEEDYEGFIYGREIYLCAESWEEAEEEFFGYVEMYIDGEIGYFNEMKRELGEIKVGKRTTTEC